MPEGVRKLNVAPDVQVIIDSVDGDLAVQGTPNVEIQAVGEGIRLRVDEENHRVVVVASSDCALQVPESASLLVDAIHGDLKCIGIRGGIKIDHVGGDSIIRDCGSVFIVTASNDVDIKSIVGDVKIESVGSDAKIKDVFAAHDNQDSSENRETPQRGSVLIETIGSDFLIRNIEGDVIIENVGSDAKVRGVQGRLQVENIGSDAVITDIAGGIQIENVGSDLILETPFLIGNTYRVENVGSDALINLEADASVTITAESHEDHVVDLDADYQIYDSSDDVLTIKVGEGDAKLVFNSVGSDIKVMSRRTRSEFVENLVPDNLDEIITEQIDEQVERMQRDAIRIQIEAERAAERARAEAERARERASRAAERAREEAKRTAERVKSKTKRGFKFEFNMPPMPPMPKMPSMPPMPPMAPMPPMPPMPSFGSRQERGEPVSNNERMAVLKMLEQGQISVDEAERLLSALEGD
jgi:hypothetical protein